MTDRFNRICANWLAAFGVSIAFAGCSRSEQQAEAPVASVSENAEPPRLFPDGAFEPTMDAPLTLNRADMPSQAAPRPISLRVPESEAGLFGDAQELAADAPVDNNSEHLIIPPSDRTLAIETGDDEAPLPELVPFETSPALAHHAGIPPSTSVEESVEATDEEQAEPTATDTAEVKVPELPNVPAETAAIPAAPAVDAVAEAAIEPKSEPVPAVTDAVESTPGAPLPSTGALSISNIKSINAADRQVARLEVPTSSTTANSASPSSASTHAAPEQPAKSDVASMPVAPAQSLPTKQVPAAVAQIAAPTPSTVAQQAMPREPVAQQVTPAEQVARTAPVEKPSQAIVEAAQPPAQVLAVSPPKAAPEAAAVKPDVSPLKAQASPDKIVSHPPTERPLDATAAAVRPMAPSTPTSKSTTAAPPTSVAIEQPDDAVNRAPLPPLPIPPQPALLAKNSHDPSGQAAIRMMPSTVPAPRQPISEPSPTARSASPSRVAAKAIPPVRPTAPTPTATAQAIPARPAAEPLVTRDRPLSTADMAPPLRSAELIAVSRLADEHSRRAFDLAGRRATYSARTEFIEALQIMAHAIDAERHTAEHSQALADGLTAIKESDDFASHGGRAQDNTDVIRLAKPHVTPVLKGLQPNSISRLAAMQQYYTYAQRRLAFAVGREPSGSLALYGLGKLHSVLAQQPAQGIASAEPKAIVFHQAALLVDGRNYMAANDLGVLLARYGKYQQSKAALLHSLEISPQPATWHNLTVVHQQLGEVRLAQLAQTESRAAAARVKQQARANGQSVTDNATVVWLDPAEFSRSSEMWSPPAARGEPQTAGDAAPSTASKPASAPQAGAPKRGFFRK